MKVLLMDVNCKYSSTGKIVYDLYTKLREDGHEAAIAYGRGSLVGEENIYRFSPQWEVYLHALLTRITGYTSCFSYIATRRAIKYIEKFQPEVVHLHDMHGYFVNIITLAEYLKKKRIKTVWTFHCEFMYTGKCGHAYECEKWKTQCGKCPRLHEYPKSQLFDCTKSMQKRKKAILSNWRLLTIVTPSEWLQSRVQKSFLHDKKVMVVHNGTDTSVFQPQMTEKLREKLRIENKKVVLAVAPNLMSEEKGGNYVLKIAEKCENGDIVFILVGANEELDYCGNNVISVGTIKDNKVLAQYYSLADAFVICSKKETFSMTTVEALCCGTPVVGFCAGAPEAIALKEYSTFVEYGNLNKLTMALLDVLERNESNREQIALVAKKHYSKDVMTRKYFEIYKQ
ncbi:MAG: glycosyltransferase [Lachnospiraceae bacterium]|nr:glycosyltransferase [Lachnospiraceae bacterium]